MEILKLLGSCLTTQTDCLDNLGPPTLSSTTTINRDSFPPKYPKIVLPFEVSAGLFMPTHWPFEITSPIVSTPFRIIIINAYSQGVNHLQNNKSNYKERQTLHHKTPIRSFVVKSNAIERAMPCRQDSKLSPPEVDPAMLQRQTMIAKICKSPWHVLRSTTKSCRTLSPKWQPLEERRRNWTASSTKPHWWTGE